MTQGHLIDTWRDARVMSVFGADVKVSRVAFVASQGVIGLLIARGVPASLLSTLSQHWLVFIFGVVAVTVLANTLG